MNAFVLTGGGSLGSIPAGMLRALYERDVAPNLIVGTSVGAINGSFIASRPQSVHTAQSLSDVWLGLKRPHIFPMDMIGGLLGFVGQRSGLVSNRALRPLVVDIAHFQNQVELVVLPPPCPVSVAPHDFGQAAELIERAQATAAAFLDGAREGVSLEIPAHLQLAGPHL